MATITILPSVQGARQLQRLARRFREHGDGAELRRDLRRNLRERAKPVVAEVKAAALRVQVSSTRGGIAYPNRSTGLRARVAKATKLSFARSGVTILVSAKAFGAYGSTLPKYLDSELEGYGRWRHPVFGKDVWTAQKGNPFFFVTIRRNAHVFRQGVLDAIDDALDKLK